VTSDPPELGHLVVALLAGPLVLAVAGSGCAAAGPLGLGVVNLAVGLALAGVEVAGLTRPHRGRWGRALRELAAGWLVLTTVAGVLWAQSVCA
jgi:hypothetical protein